MQSVTLHLQQLASAAELRVSRYTSGALAALLVVGAVAPQTAGSVLGLVPGYTLSNYYLWTFVTAGLLHTSALLGAANLALFVALSPPLERAWGSRSWLLFLVLVDAAISLVVFALLIGLYAVTDNELFLFRSVCGFSGVNAAVAVAAKQRWPDQPLLPLPQLPATQALRCEHLPFAVVSLTSLLWALGVVGLDVLVDVVLGTLIAFVYLRFYAVDAVTGETGDLRDEFDFAHLLPDVLGVRGSVNLLAAVPFHLLVRSGLVAAALKSHAGRAASQSGEADPATQSLLLPPLAADAFRAVDPQAERRRLLAIRAIDEKLKSLAEHSQQQSQQQQQQQHADQSAQQPPQQQQAASETSLLLSGAVLPDDAEMDRMEREVTGGAHAPQQVAISVQQPHEGEHRTSASLP